MRPRKLLLTCEHGGNRIPPRYVACFAHAQRSLASHAGFDPGALALARRLARRCGGLLYAATVSRLLIDLNRSPGHPRLFSSVSARFDLIEKQRIIDRYYRPHRDRIENEIQNSLEQGDAVLHVAVHSFAPRLRGVTRRADVGLLYDPSRQGERRLVEHWAGAMRGNAPLLRVRFNYPYRGKADGLATFLRRRFGAEQYWGIELEVNQKHLAPKAATRPRVLRAVEESLAQQLKRMGG